MKQWQMLPHEGYNMLYAQGMGDEYVLQLF